MLSWLTDDTSNLNAKILSIIYTHLGYFWEFMPNTYFSLAYIDSLHVPFRVDYYQGELKYATAIDHML
jgi:hypothetical protein